MTTDFSDTPPARWGLFHRYRGVVLAGVIGALLGAVIGSMIAVQVTREPQHSLPQDPKVLTSYDGPEMSRHAATELTAMLTDTDWNCYATSLERGEAERCFVRTEAGDGVLCGTLTLLYQGDRVVLAKVDVDPYTSGIDSADAAPIRRLFDEVSVAMGDTVLDGRGDAVKLYYHKGDSKTNQRFIGAATLLSARPFTLRLVNVAPDVDALNTKYVGALLPPLSGRVAELKKYGFDCPIADETYTKCVGGTVKGVSITVTDRGDGEWQFRSKPSSQNADAGRAIGHLLSNIDAETGTALTDDSGQDFLTSNPRPGEQGDFGDYSLTVNPASNASEFTVTLSQISEASGSNAAGW